MRVVINLKPREFKEYLGGVGGGGYSIILFNHNARLNWSYRSRQKFSDILLLHLYASMYTW